MKYVHIGWYQEDNHDKVWGIIQLTGNDWLGNYVTFWGRRGKKLQTKIYQDQSEWNMDRLFEGKASKGYQQIDITKLNEESINEITDLGVLAPLHQYSALKYIKIMAEAMPGIDQYAYFDTIFHADVPTIHRMFAIPYKFYEEGVMRYGFHGIACESVLYNMERICDMSRYRKIVIAHLGNGCSATAVKDGLSFETSMGFTALDGLVMGTRCGRIDPGVLLYLAHHYGMSHQEIEKLLYKECGLKGTSGISSDMRQLEESNEKRARGCNRCFLSCCYRRNHEAYRYNGRYRCYSFFWRYRRKFPSNQKKTSCKA